MAAPIAMPRERGFSPRPRLSEEVFGFRWSELVPCEIGSGGARLRLAEYSEIRAFLNQHHGAILDPKAVRSGFAQLEDAASKEKFCDRVADSFVLEHEERPVGVFVGQSSDWSTYYLRYLAVLPEHREHGVAMAIVEKFAAFLAPRGFERLEVDVAVSHRRQLRRLLRGGFHMVATLNSERWGASVRLARFLSERCETVFLDQFTAGLRS